MTAGVLMSFNLDTLQIQGKKNQSHKEKKKNVLYPITLHLLPAETRHPKMVKCLELKVASCSPGKKLSKDC